MKEGMRECGQGKRRPLLEMELGDAKSRSSSACTVTFGLFPKLLLMRDLLQFVTFEFVVNVIGVTSGFDVVSELINEYLRKEGLPNLAAPSIDADSGANIFAFEASDSGTASGAECRLEFEVGFC